VDVGERWCDDSEGEDLGEDVNVHAGVSERVVGGAVGERSREMEMFNWRGLTTVMGSRGGRVIVRG
jgi:hypothetical protein